VAQSRKAAVLAVSASSPEHVSCRTNRLNLVMPMLPCRFDAPKYFDAIKRLCQHVPSAQIQRFRPKTFVGKPGRDDQGRRMRLVPNTFQYLSPSSRHQIPFTEHHGDGVLSQYGKRGEKTISFEQGPRGVPHNGLQGQMILFQRADGKNL
jgi:hypothetical protein